MIALSTLSTGDQLTLFILPQAAAAHTHVLLHAEVVFDRAYHSRGFGVVVIVHVPARLDQRTGARQRAKLDLHLKEIDWIPFECLCKQTVLNLCV